MKNNWFTSVFAIVGLLVASVLFSAGMTPGQQLTESPGRMLTPNEMRALAGAFACDQGTCSVYSFTDDVSSCVIQYVKYWVSDCQTDYGNTCSLVYAANIVKQVQFDLGNQGWGFPRDLDYCTTQAIRDFCWGGILRTDTYVYGRDICDD